MQRLKAALLHALAHRFSAEPERFARSLEVLDHAQALARKTPEADPRVLLVAAAGIELGHAEAERRHGMSNRPTARRYGPAQLREAFGALRIEEETLERAARLLDQLAAPPQRPAIEFTLLAEAEALVTLSRSPQLLHDPTRLAQAVREQFRSEAGQARAQQELLGRDSTFVRMGKVYKLLVDEKKRRKREEPLLLELLEQLRDEAEAAPAGDTPVLDLACGTGFHARLLARHGYPVTAVDASPTLLDEARRRKTPEQLRYLEADLLEPLPLEPRAALTLLLGNTLCLFPDKRDLRRALRNAAAATRPGGLILTQTVNYESLGHEGPGTVVRQGRAGGRETLLTKTMASVGGKDVLITLCAAQREDSDGSWHSFSRVSRLRPLKAEQIRRQARETGLRALAAWGDMQGHPFDRKTSPDLVLLFQKTQP